MQLRPKVNAQPYPWPLGSDALDTSTALVIIDMQRDFCAPGGYLEHQGYDIGPVRSRIPKIKRVLDVFRAQKLPVYHTREGHRADLSTLAPREAARSRNNVSGFGIGDPGPLGRILIRGEQGHDTIPELYPLPGEPVIDKPGKGAFANTDFELLLKIRGISKLVLAGATTECCVASTMREANDRGLECLLLEDACAGTSERQHDAAVDSVKLEGGLFGAVATVDSVLEALHLGRPPKAAAF